MRIWLLTTEYTPTAGGGIGTYAHTWAHLLAAHGHAVTVFVRIAPAAPVRPAAPGVTERTTWDGPVRLIHFDEVLPPAYRKLQGPARLSWIYANAVARAIAVEGPPDLLESQEYLGLPAYLLQRKLTGDPALRTVPVVVTAHSPEFLLAPLDGAAPGVLPAWWTGELERFSLRAADRLVVPSTALRDRLVAALPGLAPAVIPNPFPVPPTAPPLGDQLLYVGRIQRLKGVPVLLEALEQLWADDWTVPLHLVGGDTPDRLRGGSLQAQLLARHRTAADRGLLHFHGWQPPAAVQAFLARAAVVVVPSLFENLPYVVLEAMGAGRVVVTTDTGGQRDLIEPGVSGFLVPANDPAALAATLRAAWARDPAARAAMGRAARAAVAAHCDPERVLAAKLALYEAAAAPPRRSFPFIRPVAPRPPLQTGRRELSVVIPYFNLGATVQETLDSLLAVRDVDLEILLVDDASTDLASIRQLYRIAWDYPRVRIVRAPHQGLARTRNYGAQRAQGTFLAFLDADDKVDPAYYPRAVALLRQYDNVSFVGCWAQYFGAATDIWPTWNPEPPYALFHNLVNSSGLVFRRDDWLAFGQNDPDFVGGYEDYASVIQLLAAGCGGIVIPAPLWHYRVRPDSMSRGFTPAAELGWHALLVQKHPELYRRWVVDLIPLFNANGPHYRWDTPMGLT